MKHLITFNESFEKNPDEDRELVLDIFQDIIDEYELQELDDTLGWSDMVDSIFNGDSPGYKVFQSIVTGYNMNIRIVIKYNKSYISSQQPIFKGIAFLSQRLESIGYDISINREKDWGGKRGILCIDIQIAFPD